MKRLVVSPFAAAVTALALAAGALFLGAAPLGAQQAPPVPPRATAYATAPDIPFESVPNFTRSGDTRLFQFDQNGTFVREIGQGLYVVKFDPEGRVLMTMGEITSWRVQRLTLKVR